MPETRRPAGMLRLPSYALGQLYRSMQGPIETRLRESGLSMQTHIVLVCLAEYGEMSQQGISDHTAVDRSDMVRRIDALEKLGQVARRPDPDDRRRHVVSLTPDGREALRRADDIAANVTNEALARLTPDDRVALHRLALLALGEPASLAGSPSRA